jgi:hypothetical protein
VRPAIFDFRFAIADMPGGVRVGTGRCLLRHSALSIQYSVFVGLLLALFSGCAGYQVGHDSLYPTDIRTVYVPMFESNSFRRNLGERLTEAVIKEIEAKARFKVVSSPEADSVLTGRLLSETKRVINESGTDEARQSELNMQVEVVWMDRRGDLIAQNTVPLPPEMVDVVDTAFVVPEVGHSIAVSQQAAIQQLAEQIVGLMEVPW